MAKVAPTNQPLILESYTHDDGYKVIFGGEMGDSRMAIGYSLISLAISDYPFAVLCILFLEKI